MNRKYNLIKLDNPKYDYLVIASSYENPIDFMEEILTEINKENVKIIFDFTLINGTHENRYLEYDSSKNGNYIELFIIVKEIDNDIKAISRKFFIENEKMVKDSIIPDALKFLITTDLI